MAGSAGIDPVRGTASFALEPLWRQVLGRKLRVLRLGNGQKLSETAARAGERGLKEPSSEMIAAIAGALGVTLLDLSGLLADDLRSIRDGDDRHAAGEVGEFSSGQALAFAA
jgi:transcriptional regulator with XRE-family HTH domain